MRGVINELRRTPLRNCLKRGSRDAPGGYLARVLGPKRAEWDGLGALWARVSGTSETFQTVSEGNSANFAITEFSEVEQKIGPEGRPSGPRTMHTYPT